MSNTFLLPHGTVKTKVKISESQLQQAIVKRVLKPLMEHGKLVYCAVPNGGWRHKATAGRMKGEGVIAGWPDLQVFWKDIIDGRTWPCAMFIELKVFPNTPSDNQITIRNKLCEAGFDVHCVRVKTIEEGCSAVIKILEDNGVI